MVDVGRLRAWLIRRNFKPVAWDGKKGTWEAIYECDFYCERISIDRASGRVVFTRLVLNWTRLPKEYQNLPHTCETELQFMAIDRNDNLVVCDPTVLLPGLHNMKTTNEEEPF